MPSRPNYFLFLATACSLLYVFSAPASAFQEVAPNFPSRISDAISRLDTKRKPVQALPVRDEATASRKIPGYQGQPAPMRQRVKAIPVSSNALTNPLRLSKPESSSSSAPQPATMLPSARYNGASAAPKSGQQNRALPSSAMYKPKSEFGTVMTFPATSPVPYQPTTPKPNRSTSFSFGDTTPIGTQPPSPQLHPHLLKRQFALQQHVMEQQKQIEQLKQMVLDKNPAPPSVASQPLGETNSEMKSLGSEPSLAEPKARIPAKAASTPIVTNFSSPPPDTSIIPSAAIPVDLATSVIGPEALVEGTPDEFEIIVTNNGDVSASDVIIQVTIPDDITVSRLDREAWLDDKKRTVSWKVPEIAGREREVIKYSAVSKTAGTYMQKVIIGMGSDLKGDTTFETVVITEEDFNAINQVPESKE